MLSSILLLLLVKLSHMNKTLIGTLLLISSFIPALSSAQVGDVAPTSVPQCADISTNLGYTSKDSDANNNAVSMLQDFLSAKGYLTVPYAGYFGRATKAAVIAFQKDNGINGTGYVGPVTRAKIKAIDCDGAPAGTNSAVSSPANTVQSSAQATPSLSATDIQMLLNLGIITSSQAGTLSAQTIPTIVPINTNTQTNQSVQIANWNGADSWQPLLSMFDGRQSYGKWSLANSYGVVDGDLHNTEASDLHNRVINTTFQKFNLSDYEFTAQVRFKQGIEAGVCARMDSIGNGYCFVSSWGGGSNLMIGKFMVNSQNPKDIQATDNVQAIGGGISQNIWYNMKIQVSGSTIKGKIWKFGNTEPSDWAIVTTDTDFSYGTIGLYTYEAQADFHLSNFSQPTQEIVPAPAPVTTSTPAPIITSFYASPSTITAGQPTTLYWTSTDTTSCSASFPKSDYNPSGSTTITPVSTDSYTLSCIGPGGNVSKTIKITVNPAVVVQPIPTITIVSPNGGETVTQLPYTILWSSSNPGSANVSIDLVSADSNEASSTVIRNIATSTPNTGSYIWKPSGIQAYYKILITSYGDIEGYTGHAVKDFSDNSFWY